MSKHTLSLGNAAPNVSCCVLPARLWRARMAAAEQLANQQGGGQPAAADRAGGGILWHPEFPTRFRILVADTPLFCLTAVLSERLADMNRGLWLDEHDFAYLADILRDAQHESRFAAETLHLRRALAWVKMQGNAVGERPDVVE